MKRPALLLVMVLVVVSCRPSGAADSSDSADVAAVHRSLEDATGGPNGIIVPARQLVPPVHGTPAGRYR